MAAESTVRFILKTTGLGQEKEISAYSLLSDTPTQVTGPIVMTVNTTQQLLDTLALVSGQLIGLYIKALTSGIYFSPFSTAAAVSASLYIPTGQFNWVTFKSTITALPSVIAAIPGSQIEYAVVGIT